MEMLVESLGSRAAKLDFSGSKPEQRNVMELLPSRRLIALRAESMGHREGNPLRGKEEK